MGVAARTTLPPPHPQPKTWSVRYCRCGGFAERCGFSMENELLSSLRKFSLTAEEETGVELEQKDVVLSLEESRRSLFSKIHGSKKANFLGLKNTLRSTWVTRAPFQVRELGFNLYQFVFKEEDDKDKVLNSKVWTFDNQYILLKEWYKGMVIEKEDFNTVELWVQVQNAPNHWITTEIGLKIGKLFPRTLDIFIPESGSAKGRVIKLLVVVNLLKPLLRGSNIKLGGEQRWVDFKYENLVGLCFYCGCIGHIERGCSVRKDDLQNDNLREGQFGDWLKAEEGYSGNRRPSSDSVKSPEGRNNQTNSLDPQAPEPSKKREENVPSSSKSPVTDGIREVESTNKQFQNIVLENDFLCPMEEENNQLPSPFPNKVEPESLINIPLKEKRSRTPSTEISINTPRGIGNRGRRGGKAKGIHIERKMASPVPMMEEYLNPSNKRGRSLLDENCSDEEGAINDQENKKQRVEPVLFPDNSKVVVASHDWPQPHQ
ncbi:hypothetical protein DH2020_020459 [Rehmannia glutinosa]|uniref:CCHC-type domain-containing protein n=1 Tax=Rehmannia glutinosa TaxID=99300 RepID=A0ABR0WKB8_REHGL